MSFGQNELIGDGSIWVHGIATDAEGSSARGRDAILFISPTPISSFPSVGMTDYANARKPKAIPEGKARSHVNKKDRNAS